jgi:hypothetical protein
MPDPILYPIINDLQMKKWTIWASALCLLGCGAANAPTNAAGAGQITLVTETTASDSAADANLAPQDSIISRDTLYAPAWAPDYRAEIITVDYMTYDADMDADLRATAYMIVKAYHAERVLFRTKVRGSAGIYWGPCWLTAVADDGSYWLLHCQENMVGVGAANPVATICLDGHGKEIKDFGPLFDPYTEQAIVQLDGRRLLEGGRVLDMKAKKWENLSGGKGAGFCADTIGERVLLVMGENGKGQDAAFFYSLPDLKLRLSFPCGCHGEEASMFEEIYYHSNPNGRKVSLAGPNDMLYHVDLLNWSVDSVVSR